jgi:hypothetical protein
MIKKVLLTAALLAPGLAYGQVSAPLDPPVAPAGDLTVPAPAAAAGFTTLALNADFTSPAYSNKATFVANCGASGRQLWNWVLGYQFTLQNCADISVVADTGVTPNLPQVLHINLPPSEYPIDPNTHLPDVRGVIFDYPAVPYNPSDPCVANHSPCFPTEMYISITWRSTLPSINQDGQGAHSAHLFVEQQGNGMLANGSVPSAATEVDMFEGAALNSTNPNQNGQINGGINGQNAFGTYTYWQEDKTVYHKSAALVTSNGSNTYWYCLFKDDVLLGNCTNQSNTSVGSWPSIVFSQHDNSIGIGLATENGFLPVNPLEMFIQKIEVWECSTWQTASCPGTLVTHWPFP